MSRQRRSYLSGQGRFGGRGRDLFDDPRGPRRSGPRTSGRSDLIEIAAALVHETEKAFLLDDGGQQVWVPKAAVERNDDGTWTMPESLAREKGLI